VDSLQFVLLVLESKKDTTTSERSARWQFKPSSLITGAM